MKTNKGKKYITLRGNEVASPENEKRGRDFMSWYAANMERLKYYIRGAGYQVDEDLLSDTMIRIYEAIALKGAQINDYTGYFLRSYRGMFLNNERKSNTVSCTPLLPDRTEESGYVLRERDRDVSARNTEILDFVRAKFPEPDGILFEIYIGLLLSESDTNLPRMFKIPPLPVWRSISRIRRVLNYFFDYFLSMN